LKNSSFTYSLFKIQPSSWNVLSEKGFRADLKTEDNKILKKNEIWRLLRKEGKDLVFHTTESENARKASTQEIWHQRLGHILGKMIKLKKHAADPEGIIDDAPATYDACNYGKSTQKIPRDSGNECTEILQKIHSDIWGPAQMESLRRKRYFISFIDEYSRYTEVYYLR
jgi:hypothetical protein